MLDQSYENIAADSVETRIQFSQVRRRCSGKLGCIAICRLCAQVCDLGSRRVLRMEGILSGKIKNIYF